MPTCVREARRVLLDQFGNRYGRREELAGLSHPLLTLISPKFLENRVATYNLLREGGYTNVVVYLAQQITQFQHRGMEFAMQHLGTEDEMKQAWPDLLATLSPEELLGGLTPTQRDRLRLLLQQSPEESDTSSTK